MAFGAFAGWEAAAADGDGHLLAGLAGVSAHAFDASIR
jgi:hypothetical protein